MNPYVIKYHINGAKFRRTFAARRQRDDYADLLVSNGITVVTSKRREPPIPFSERRAERMKKRALLRELGEG
jgi:hypothetical protein